MIVEQQQQTHMRRSVTDTGTEAWAALQFLTRLPTPALKWREDTLAHALLFFPAIGLALGAAAGALNLLLAAHLSRTVAAALTIAALIAMTGALHEDGLADCADAFGSRHSRERTLSILHDSRIGTYGAAALALSVLLRVLLLAALPPGCAVAAMAAALMLSRCAILPLTMLPPATPLSGQGSRIATHTPRWIIVAGVLFSVAGSIALLHLRALPALLAATLVTAGCAAFFRRRLNGVTGDCFGASVQCVELAVLLVAAWTP